MPEDAPGWCNHCDMPRVHCEHGLPKDVVAAFDGVFSPRTDLEADGPTITATQVSDCPGCRKKIEPDETITHTEHGWAHAEHVDPGPRDHTGNKVDWGGFA
jgi:hypothetical protein